MEGNNAVPNVFISYSWTVQSKVIELAQRLYDDHIHVVLDVYDLKDGQDKYAFMEQSVNDPSISKVLIICDKSYTDKANARQGGVGDEVVIITPEIYGNTKQEKFIPIIFERDENGEPYRPHFIKSRIYIDLSDDSEKYESEYEKLIRNIHNKPSFTRPALGPMPTWLEEETANITPLRNVIKRIANDNSGSAIKARFELKRAEDAFVEAALAYDVDLKEPVETALIKTIKDTKVFRDLFMDYCEALVERGVPLSTQFVSIIESLYNAFQEKNNSEANIDLHHFMLWELMIDITAFCLYYELYNDLHQIITYAYVLNGLHGEGSKVYNFTHFREYLQVIENRCKPKCENPRYFTLSGNILVSRNKAPYLSKETISNADVVLYQLGEILDLPVKRGDFDYWFPDTYNYRPEYGKQAIWQRMVSINHCEKLFPLFGVSSVDELKGMVAKSVIKEKFHHIGDYFNCAPCIQNSIQANQVGTVK